MKNNKGFTLTEILATLVIIGIIIAIAIPSFNKLSEQFEKDYYNGLVDTVLVSAKNYYKDHPEERPTGNLYSSAITLTGLIVNKYVDAVKVYNSNEDCSGYVVVVNENGKYNYQTQINCDGQNVSSITYSSDYIKSTTGVEINDISGDIKFVNSNQGIKTIYCRGEERLSTDSISLAYVENFYMTQNYASYIKKNLTVSIGEARGEEAFCDVSNERLTYEPINISNIKLNEEITYQVKYKGIDEPIEVKIYKPKKPIYQDGFLKVGDSNYSSANIKFIGFEKENDLGNLICAEKELNCDEAIADNSYRAVFVDNDDSDASKYGYFYSEYTRIENNNLEPECEFLISDADGENGWYKSDIKVEMRISNATEYGINTTDSIIYNTAKEYIHSEEGTYNLELYGYVKNGTKTNKCEIKRDVKLDKTPPDCTLTTDKTNIEIDNNLVPKIKVYFESNAKETKKWALSEENNISNAFSENKTLYLDPNTTTTVYGAVKDEAGNIGECKISIIDIPDTQYCNVGLVYDGTQKTLTKALSTGSGYSFSNNKKINAGEYEVIAKLKKGYSWSDGTRTEKTFKCSIAKKDITFKSEDASKPVDTIPLTKEMCSISSGNVISNQRYICNFTGSQTNIGQSQNKFTAQIMSGESDVSANYNINYNYGTLTVQGIEFETIVTDLEHNTYNGDWTNSPLLVNVFAKPYYTEIKSVYIDGVEVVEPNVQNSSNMIDIYSNYKNEGYFRYFKNFDTDIDSDIEIKLIDKENNEYLFTTTLKIDITKPTLNVELIDSDGTPYPSKNWTNKSVTRYLRGADLNGSGIAKYEYVTGSNCTGTPKVESENFVGEKSWTTAYSNYACHRVVDNAGNYSDWVESDIKIDKTAPTCTFNIRGRKGNNDWYIGPYYILEIDGEDSQSGISADYDFKQYTYYASANGVEYPFTVYDNAGNSTTCNSPKIYFENENIGLTTTVDNWYSIYSSRSKLVFNKNKGATVNFLDKFFEGGMSILTAQKGCMRAGSYSPPLFYVNQISGVANWLGYKKAGNSGFDPNPGVNSDYYDYICFANNTSEFNNCSTVGTHKYLEEQWIYQTKAGNYSIPFLLKTSYTVACGY